MMNKPYHLYASKTMQVPNGVEFSLVPYCANGRYMLVYTDKQLDEHFKQIGESVKLEQEERTWLMECKFKINARAMKENEHKYAEILNTFCDNLALELQHEKEKL